MGYSLIMNLLFCITSSMIVLRGYGSKFCLDTEKNGLLQIKSHFSSILYSKNYDLLDSWVANGKSDCCHWEKVKCNPSTGRITQLFLRNMVWPDEPWTVNMTVFYPFEELQILDLSHNMIGDLVGNEGSLLSLETLILSGNQITTVFLQKVPSNLKQLQMLDLGFNNMDGSIISPVSTYLMELKALDLSGNQLNESITGLCELRNLQELSLSMNRLSGSPPNCLQNLASIRVLDLSVNNFNGYVPSFIMNLTSLEYLSISNNGFYGEFSLSPLLNRSKLEVLFLSNNGLHVEAEDSSWPSNVQLQYLGLGNCNLSCQTKAFPKFLFDQCNLRYLDLSYNGLVGSFPTWLLQNNSKLEHLFLANNLLTGCLQLPERNHSLLHVDISRNRFSGEIPEDIGTLLPALTRFNISENSFQGHIPFSISNMSQLELLDLSENNFSGEVSSRFFSDCTSLKYLLLSKNKLQGEIIPKYMNSTLSSLYLDNNHFSGTILEGGLLKIFDSLQHLDISNNDVSGQLPSLIGNFTELKTLSMAGNQLHGSIPSEICKLDQIVYLDLSGNELTGEIPSCNRLLSLRFLHLHGNILTGRIPQTLARSLQLVTLDLRNNQLLGGIPLWINKLSNLRILLLGYNQLHGKLPIQLCQLELINLIDLSNNNFSGSIPSCFGSLSFGAVELNKLYDEFVAIGAPIEPCDGFLSSKLHLNLPIIKLEAVTGQEEVDFVAKRISNPYKGDILSNMSGLDLSCNQLTGYIPLELCNLEMIHALNLSHNCLSGSIPVNFSNLQQIESLDLSYNNLSGAIPSTLVDLTFLANFNVSYNNLRGQVPEAGQFADFDENNYRGNPLLCGSLLPGRCMTNEPEHGNTTVETEKGDIGFDWEVFFWSLGMSCAAILLAFILVLYINPYWRRSWFIFIDLHFLWWFHP